MGRRHFSFKEKLNYVEKLRIDLKKGKFLCSLSSQYGIDRKTIKQRLNSGGKILDARDEHHPEKTQDHPGKPSILQPVEPALLRYIFEQREQGFAVSISLLVEHAKRILPSFKKKSAKAQDNII